MGILAVAEAVVLMKAANCVGLHLAARQDDRAGN